MNVCEISHNREENGTCESKEQIVEIDASLDVFHKDRKKNIYITGEYQQ